MRLLSVREGIELLHGLRRSLPPLMEELAQIPADRGELASLLDQAEQDLRMHLADWDMKGSDARKLMERASETVGLVRSSALSAIGEQIDRAMEELEAARLEPDRGTHDNIPWWTALTL